MANHPSALKRARQNEKRRNRNSTARSQVRTSERKLRSLLTDKDSKKVQTQLQDSISVIMKASSKGVIPKRAASRKVARLSRAAHKAAAKRA